MASPPVSYFAWLRFQRAVGRWARLALGLDADEQRSVIWADHNVQRPPLPYLSLQVTSGPSRRAQDAEQWPRLEPLSIAVQVLPSAVVATGDACRFFVNGELFEYLAAPGATVTIARNALLASVQASVQLGATATSSGVDSIILTADRPGSLRAEAAVGCAATVTATQLVSMVVGPREIRVRATAYGAPEPRVPGDVGVAGWIELLAGAAQPAGHVGHVAQGGLQRAQDRDLRQEGPALREVRGAGASRRGRACGAGQARAAPRTSGR